MADDQSLVIPQQQVTQYNPAFSREQLDLLKRTVASGLTDDEFMLFTMQAQRLRLDPFNRQIHAVKRWNSREQREVMAIQVAIDGFRAIADRTGDYAPGREPTYEYNMDGSLKSATAYVMKYARGTWHEVAATAFWAEYAQTNKEGKPTQFWVKMPHLMLAKVAEALALRKAFPEQLGGVYSDEEMMQADNVVDVVPSSKEIVKTQPDDIITLVEEARKLGVTFRVEGDSLRPVNGDKMTKELSKKVLANSARIVEYIKANAAPAVPPVPQTDTEPEFSKRQPDEPPTQKAESVPPKTQAATKTNGDAPKRPLSPDALKAFIHKKAEKLNEQGAKVTDRDRSQLAAAMDAAFTDMDKAKREEKRHRVCKFLTGFESLGAKSDPKMPDWYVGALKAWLSFSYADGKYVLSEFVIKEANACEHEALMQEGGMPPLSPQADFEAECLTVNYTADEIKLWLANEVGWAITDWGKCEPAVCELIAIARTQKLDLLKDGSMRDMAILKAAELWPVT